MPTEPTSPAVANNTESRSSTVPETSTNSRDPAGINSVEPPTGKKKVLSGKQETNAEVHAATTALEQLALDPGNEGARTDVALSTRMVPMYYSVDPFSNPNPTSQTRRMERFLEEVQYLGAYVMVRAEGSAESPPLRHSWLYDSGALVSQISGEAAARLWSTLNPLGLANLICETATRKETVSRQLCMLKGIQLLDVSRGNQSVKVDTHFMINPDLTIHPFVMGLNTMADLRLACCMRTERVTDESGITFKLLSANKARRWDVSDGGLASPVKREAFDTRTPSLKFDGGGGTSTYESRDDGSSATRDPQEASAKDSRSSYKSRSGEQPALSASIPKNNRTATARSRRSEASRANRSFYASNHRTAVPPGMDRRGKAARGRDSAPRRKKTGKTRFYAVALGYAPGIYQSDRSARKAYEGFSCPIHRVFKSKELAVAFMNEHCREKWVDDTSQKGSAPCRSSTSETRVSAAYTPVDRHRVKRTSRRMKEWEKEDQDMVERIARVSLAASATVDALAPHLARGTVVSRTRLRRLTESSSSDSPDEGHLNPRERPPASSYVEEEAVENSPTRKSHPVTPERDSSLDSAEGIIIGENSHEDFSQLVEDLSPISASSYPRRNRDTPPASTTPVHDESDASYHMYRYTKQLFNSPPPNTKAAAATVTTQPEDTADHEETGSVRSAPSKLRLFVSGDGLRVAMSEMKVAIKAAASLGSYIPAAVGNYAATWLFDSGACLSQASPERIRDMEAYLTPVDQAEVEFISVESRSRLPMKLFKCERFSLIQVEAAQRSEECPTYIVENPKMTTFPLLLGLQTMSDLDLAASFRNSMVRDPVGNPYRLYSKAAIPNLEESLRILTRRWSVPRTPPMIQARAARTSTSNPSASRASR